MLGPGLPPEGVDWQAFSRLVQAAFPGARLLRAWPLSGGISARMTALEYLLPGGEKGRVVARQPGEETLRSNPRAAAREYRLLQIVRACGIPVPAPLLLDESREILPGPCLLIEFSEGEPVFAPVHSGLYLEQAAEVLARIHQVTPDTFAWSAAGENWGEEPGKVGAEGLDGPRRRGNEALREGTIRDALEPVWPIPGRNAPVLLHGDFWPGNWLWMPENGGRLVAVVDWEDGCVGDPLTDLAISRLDVLCIFGKAALRVFTTAYFARSQADPTCLPYWDLYAVLRMIRLAGDDLEGWAAFYPPRGRPDITAETLRRRILWFADQALSGAGSAQVQAP